MLTVTLSIGRPAALAAYSWHPALHLRAGPDLAGARRQTHRAVHRFHRGMGEKRQLVVGIEAFALREALVDVAFGFGDDAVLLARRAQVVPDVGGIDLGVRPFVPGHFQRVEPLLGGPHMVADDGDEIVEHDDLPHARHFFRGAVVDMLRPCRRAPDTGQGSRTSCPARMASMP